MMGAWLRRVSLALLLAVLGFGSLTARVVMDGEAEMKASDAAFDRGEVRLATLHARRAAVLYAPGAPHVDRAYARLTAVALGAEAVGQLDVAEAAWRAMRGAALETRHVRVPRALDLQRADQSLARLAGVPLRQAGQDPDERVRAAAAELARDDAPDPPWVGALAFAFVLVASGLAVAAARGVRPDGSLSQSGALIGAALTLVGMLLWALAVLRA